VQVRMRSHAKRARREFTITPELEKCGKSGSALMSHTESTPSLTAIVGSLDVVLEQSLNSVVGESLTQFDDGNQPCRNGQTFTDMPQNTFLFICGLLAFRCFESGFLVGRAFLCIGVDLQGTSKSILLLVVVERLVQPIGSS
jgi:hypothetical protein